MPGGGGPSIGILASGGAPVLDPTVTINLGSGGKGGRGLAGAQDGADGVAAQTMTVGDSGDGGISATESGQ